MLQVLQSMLSILRRGVAISVLLALLAGCGATALQPDAERDPARSESTEAAQTTSATAPGTDDQANPTEAPAPEQIAHDDQAETPAAPAPDREKPTPAEPQTQKPVPDAPAAPEPAMVRGTVETATEAKPKAPAPVASAPPAAAEQPNVAKTKTPTTGQPAARSEPPKPTMDLGDLEQRLRKTKAIGLFTKLEIKSEVGNLLESVEDYHGSRSGLELPQLKERFNLLVMKLLVLLEDGDPQLRHDLAQARPALWTALADPHQFTSIKGP